MNNLIIQHEYVYRAVPNMVPIRRTKGGPLVMVQQGFRADGIPYCKIIMGDREHNPMLEILKPYLVEEV